MTTSEISAILKMQSEITDKHQETRAPHRATVQATGREVKKMKNIIDEVIRAMERGASRDEAINDAANIHATDYDSYMAIWAALNASVPTR